MFSSRIQSSLSMFWLSRPSFPYPRKHSEAKLHLFIRTSVRRPSLTSVLACRNVTVGLLLDRNFCTCTHVQASGILKGFVHTRCMSPLSLPALDAMPSSCALLEAYCGTNRGNILALPTSFTSLCSFARSTSTMRTHTPLINYPHPYITHSRRRARESCRYRGCSQWLSDLTNRLSACRDPL